MNKNVLKKIIKSAYKLFQEKGYNETTILDICEACSITKTTFYRYVSSKEDLLSYYFDDINDNLGSLVIQIAKSRDCVECIYAAFDLPIQRMLNTGRELYAQLYVSNLNGNNNSFEEIIVLKEIVIALISKAQETGQIQNMSNPEQLYDTCKKLCFGCGILWCLNQIEDVKKEFRNAIKVTLQVVE